MKNTKFILYTREDIARELTTRGETFVDEWFAFWIG